MNLTELKIGQKSRITKIGSVGPIRRRLMDMGVLVGEQIKIDKIAPMGDPLEVTIKNYKLSLRINEAANIDVEVI
jgi:ferrous iron transport protein A